MNMKNKEMNSATRYRILLACACAALLAACTDTLYEESGKVGGEQQGLQFAFSTTEMGDELMSIGAKGATRSGAAAEADRFAEHRLLGANPYGLKVHRQPLPLVGIHHGAVRADLAESEHSLTRAGANEVVATDGTNFHDSLTIWGYTNSGTELFDQILLTKVRNWRNSVEWPYNQGAYMKFYAVAPSLESINMSGSGPSENTPISYTQPPILTYTLPEKANELRDVLYGESDNISIAAGPEGTVTTDPKSEHLGKDNKFVRLNFRHITTAIRFSQGVIPRRLTVKSITLSGVYAKGTYNPATDDPATGTKGAWSGQDTERPYTVNTTWVGTGNTKSENAYIDGGMTLFMIPQTVPSGASLSITLIDTGNHDKEHTITCSLAGDVWKKGYTVNYKITVGELEEGYYFTAESKELEHSNDPVTSTVDVHSYHLYTDYSSGTGVNAYRPVKWIVDGYSTDATIDGNTVFALDKKPTWLTDFHGVLDDTQYAGGNPATATFTVAKQEHERSANHGEVLYDNIGVKSTVDLSTQNPDGSAKGTTETANCYIVNRIGTYRFPLVYGNKTTGTSDTPYSEAACFKDHTGVTITFKLIEDQIKAKNSSFGYEQIEGDKYQREEYYWDGAAVASDGGRFLRGTLLWQDVWQDDGGLITRNTVSAISSGNYMQFSIGKSYPGNAVIALQARKRIGYYTKSGDVYTLDTSQGVSGYGVADTWETLWTWHIWMTDEVYKNDGTSNGKEYDSFYINGSTADDSKADHIAQLKDKDDNGTYEILPVNLGWVPDNMNFGLYKPRKVTVQLKQADGKGDAPETATVTITQHARQDLYTGTGTVYQWGRPTAFPAVHNIAGTKRKIYDIDGNDITDQFVLAQATHAGDAIGQPFHVLQTSGSSNTWFDVSSADYTANAMWNSTKKTVYDPCPPGFRVPKASIFYGFSLAEGTTGSAKTVLSDGTKLNIFPDATDGNGVTQKSGATNKGGYFFLKAGSNDRYDPVVYMPATGEWHGNKAVGTKLSDTSEQLNQPAGLYWTSDYHNNGNTQACGLWITPDRSSTSGTADKPIIGFFDEATHKFNYYSSVRAIRPMKE